MAPFLAFPQRGQGLFSPPLGESQRGGWPSLTASRLMGKTVRLWTPAGQSSSIISRYALQPAPGKPALPGLTIRGRPGRKLACGLR